MPFADEVAPVAVLEYQPQWPVDFERLAGELYNVLGSDAHAIDHIGSTSVPGLAAKDCVDIQVRVAAIQEARQVGLLAAIGFRSPARAVESSRGLGRTGMPQVGVRPAGGCAEVQRTPTPGRRPELPLRAPVP